jgi:hypothetical protein
MRPVGSTVALSSLYQIPKGSNLIHHRKYVKSHKMFCFSTVTGFRQRNIFESVSDFFGRLL